METLKIEPKIGLLDFEKPLEKYYKQVDTLLSKRMTPAAEKKLLGLEKTITSELQKIYSKLDNWQLTQVARHPNRPYSLDYIDLIFNDFMELHGDRLYQDDASTVCGTASFRGKSVVVIGQQKGRNTEENLKRNFGMPQPEGYRKALRILKFAEKFNKPVITFIDTPGAFPGLEAEEHGQGEAIAKNLREMSGLKIPVVSIVIGEGGSGGALGIGVANHVAMLQYSIYSVISPESCAAILWRSSEEKIQAANALKNDAKTALKLNAIDEIIAEPTGAAHRDWKGAGENISDAIAKALTKLCRLKPSTLVHQRIEKFAAMGVYTNG